MAIDRPSQSDQRTASVPTPMPSVTANMIRAWMKGRGGAVKHHIEQLLQANPGPFHSKEALETVVAFPVNPERETRTEMPPNHIRRDIHYRAFCLLNGDELRTCAAAMNAIPETENLEQWLKNRMSTFISLCMNPHSFDVDWKYRVIPVLREHGLDDAHYKLLQDPTARKGSVVAIAPPPKSKVRLSKRKIAVADVPVKDLKRHQLEPERKRISRKFAAGMNTLEDSERLRQIRERLQRESKS